MPDEHHEQLGDWVSWPDGDGLHIMRLPRSHYLVYISQVSPETLLYRCLGRNEQQKTHSLNHSFCEMSGWRFYRVPLDPAEFSIPVEVGHQYRMSNDDVAFAAYEEDGLIWLFSDKGKDYALHPNGSNCVVQSPYAVERIATLTPVEKESDAKPTA